MMTVAEDRDSLVAQAEQTRARLFHTLDMLDQRRQAMVHAGEQAKDLAAPVGLGVAGMLLVVLTATVVAQRRAIKRARADWRRILVQKLMPEPPPRSFLAEASHRAGVALVLLAATEIGKRVLKSL